MNWEAEWITTAQDIVSKRFEARYAGLDVDNSISVVKPIGSSSKKRAESPNDSADDDFFNDDVHVAIDRRTESNELEHYLAADIEVTKDPIARWTNKCRLYPRLSNHPSYLSRCRTGIQPWTASATLRP